MTAKKEMLNPVASSLLYYPQDTMRREITRRRRFALGLLLALSLSGIAMSQRNDQAADGRVRAFLAKTQHGWRDLNVPEADGELLHDIVLNHKYTRAPRAVSAMSDPIHGICGSACRQTCHLNRR